ncbi:piggyBac transposable element-derived protein 4-like [Leptopilina heterotoma]|uniref:piggyBac transposable element-derived protein 4-like n=1 Tax=Leptopilina heterotoma TaxID=63436 RepID=UPI001CA87284|nr:piggyBac transposable element-derived protein 4-like [Leptopilina heterotoma]
MDSDSTVPFDNSSDSDLSDNLSDITDEDIVSSNNEKNTSADESDVPLIQRRKKFIEDLTWTESGTFSPVQHSFCDSKAGVQLVINANKKSSPAEIFKLYFSEDIMEMICFQTNKYQQETLTARMASGNLKKKSRILKWESLSPDELYVFFSLKVLMGIIRKPEISMYWSSDPFLETPFFKNYMTITRFLEISAFLHFSDNEIGGGKLDKIAPVFNALVERFQEVYRPGEFISIDESLILFKGRLSFTQYNPHKRARFGLKTYQCSESKTGYVYNCKIYAGKDENSPMSKLIGISGVTVKLLLGDLAGQGRTLFIDNWYSSPVLFKQLSDEKTNVCGTARPNRLYMPKNVDTKTMKTGDMKVLHTPKMSLTVWKNKKIVRVLSTVLRPEMSVKWYLKIFYRLLDTSILNSYVVYKSFRPEMKMSFLDFRTLLVKQLISSHGTLIKKPHARRVEQSQNLSRLTARHFPMMISEISELKSERLNCFLCYKKNKITKTKTLCVECRKKALCLPCFKTYHTKLDC